MPDLDRLSSALFSAAGRAALHAARPAATPPEPPVGTVIREPGGRWFRRDDQHPDFHWRDQHGWYRWREVRNHAARPGVVVDFPS